MTVTSKRNLKEFSLKEIIQVQEAYHGGAIQELLICGHGHQVLLEEPLSLKNTSNVG